MEVRHHVLLSDNPKSNHYMTFAAPNLTYRADIDGLRAISVLAVVVYHFGLGPIVGGFMGVDVFFVISGYVITRKLHDEMLSGNFQFRSFYTARVRRILPALSVVVICSLIAGWFILLPADFASLGQQSAFAIFGSANFFFLWNTGYFDRAASLLPLLHTWSLSVEEQFYFVWPALMLAVFALGRRAICVVLAIIIVSSLIWAELTVRADDQSMAFYMLHTRAWELAIGALVVFAPVIKRRVVSDVATLTGLILVGIGFFTVSSETPFPGVSAMWACFGAGLVVWPRTTQSWATSALALPPIRYIGLISYSLYLWHWPILVLYRHYNWHDMPDTQTAVLLIFISFSLSVLTFHFVERPFRHGVSVSRRTVFSAGLAAATVALGLTISATSGAAIRLPEDARLAVSMGVKQDLPNEICILNEHVTNRTPLNQTCALNGETRVLMIGDSHATHFMNALVDSFPNVKFSLINASGCRPVLQSVGRRSCVELMQAALLEFIPFTDFHAVIVSARWRNGNSDQVGATAEHLQQFTDNVLVWGQTVEYQVDVPAQLASEALLRAPRDGVTDPQSHSEHREINYALSESLKRVSVKFYDPLSVLCVELECIRFDDAGIPFQWDYGHLTAAGAKFVVEEYRARGLTFKVPKS